MQTTPKEQAFLDTLRDAHMPEADRIRIRKACYDFALSCMEPLISIGEQQQRELSSFSGIVNRKNVA